MRKTLVLCTTLVWGGAARGGETLTWEACVAEAWRNNPELAAARSVLEGAQGDVAARTGDFAPDVSAAADYDRNGGPGVDGRGEDYSLGLSLRQNLFAGFSTRAARDRAEADRRFSSEVLRETSARVAFDLKTAFAGLLYAEEQVLSARAIEARRRENVRLVGLRFDAGREHKGAHLRSRAFHRQAQYDVSQADRARRLSRRTLAGVLGRPVFDEFKVAGTLDAGVPGDSPDFLERAAGSPAVRQAEERSLSARASLATARSRFWPEVSATGGVFRTGGDWPPDRERWSAGVGLSYPLFSGGSDYYGARSARAALDAAEARRRSALIRSALDLEDSFSSYENAVERAGVQEAFLEAARTRAGIARGQYENGLLSFDDWDSIENDLINQEKNALSARRDAVFAKAAWEFSLGEGLETP